MYFGNIHPYITLPILPFIVTIFNEFQYSINIVQQLDISSGLKRKEERKERKIIVIKFSQFHKWPVSVKIM
jgi:hypothetical protein